MNRSDRQRWVAARTLAELGELMAGWLEGELRSRPGYHGRTDLDSPELTALCAALCRAGVVTHQSQGALLWEDDVVAGVGRARTYIEAFTGDNALAGLRAVCHDTDLILVARRTPARRWFGRTQDVTIPVVEHNGRTVLTLDCPIDRSYVDVIWGGISAEAYAEVLNAWQVAIVDPQWGRNELMWDVLTQRFLDRAVAT